MSSKVTECSEVCSFFPRYIQPGNSLCRDLTPCSQAERRTLWLPVFQVFPAFRCVTFGFRQSTHFEGRHRVNLLVRVSFRHVVSDVLRVEHKVPSYSHIKLPRPLASSGPGQNRIAQHYDSTAIPYVLHSAGISSSARASPIIKVFRSSMGISVPSSHRGA